MGFPVKPSMWRNGRYNNKYANYAVDIYSTTGMRTYLFTNATARSNFITKAIKKANFKRYKAYISDF